ncbi:MAG: hypothetical protein ABMB14_04775 [Myxococcota bacterium]
MRWTGWTLGAATVLAFGLACAGGTTATDDAEPTDAAANPEPEPEPAQPAPDREGKSKKGKGRDRDGGGDEAGDDDGGGGGGGGRSPCKIVKATATTALDGHPASKAIDGDPSTAWCESHEGTGVGQRLTVVVPDGCSPTRLVVTGGNLESKATLDQFSRPMKLMVIAASQAERPLELTDVGKLPVEDARDKGQTLTLTKPLQTSDDLEMRVDSVYPGSKGQTLCIGEVALD